MWLPPVTTIAPATGAVTLAAAKEFVRLSADDTSFDVELQALLDGVIGDVERITATRLITQTVICSASSFDDLTLLPIGPVLALSALAFTDSEGALVSLTSDDWRLSGGGLVWSVAPALDTSWPATAEAGDAVRVTLQVGYGAAPANIPADIRSAILRATRAQFDGKDVDLDKLLVNHRIWL